MKKIILYVLLVQTLISGCKTGKTQNISDDFENDSLSSIWTSDKFLPGAFNIQSYQKRSGNKAVMLTVKPGDQIDEEKGTILERAELKESKKLFSVENSEYEYSFSLFIPSDFPIVPTRLVIAQWKQNCASGNCDPDNPIIAIRYVNGELFVSMQTEPEKIVLFSQKENITGQWLDFRFDIKFSRTQDGFLNAWINEKQVIGYKGATAYPEKYGYPAPGVFYFKMGLYRDQMDQPMTIYIDNYSKKQK